jgi:hypothetical protein
MVRPRRKLPLMGMELKIATAALSMGANTQFGNRTALGQAFLDCVFAPLPLHGRAIVRTCRQMGTGPRVYPIYAHWFLNPLRRLLCPVWLILRPSRREIGCGPAASPRRLRQLPAGRLALRDVRGSMLVVALPASRGAFNTISSLAPAMRLACRSRIAGSTLC